MIGLGDEGLAGKKNEATDRVGRGLEREAYSGYPLVDCIIIRNEMNCLQQYIKTVFMSRLQMRLYSCYS